MNKLAALLLGKGSPEHLSRTGPHPRIYGLADLAGGAVFTAEQLEIDAGRDCPRTS